MPIYVMTALKIPKQIIQEIDKARRKFLWDGGDEFHGGKCKVNWQRVCRPIKYGGLGVSNLTKMGRALHLRWLWYEWTFPDKPWIGMPTPCDEQDAELFAASTTVTIGDSRKALFWESPWVSSSPLKTMAPNLYRHARRKKRTVANALQDNKWINDIRHNLTSMLVTEFFKVFEILWESNTTLSQDIRDGVSVGALRRLWQPEEDGRVVDGWRGEAAVGSGGDGAAGEATVPEAEVKVEELGVDAAGEESRRRGEVRVQPGELLPQLR
uniref:Retrotransposon protein, putative, LINE subclass n=1 Tax=Oryza sativa subsp. japonica TaxID=39947 RepID=Q7XDL2_ORYSJ|nr:retrotransposon protein, putative, LINE subclass [Oryza sativa Japonica Group]